MKLKMDDAGHPVAVDGKPVFVAEDGKEVVFDYAATLGTITRLNGEARGHRERAEAAEGKLKAFDGIEDAEAARGALATVKNLDAKKLIDAGEAERVRADAIKAVEDKYKPVLRERDGLVRALDEEVIGGAFARSQYIGAKLAIPADLVRAAFGASFVREEGAVVAKDRNGNRLLSRARPGELANFDEALEMLVDAYPHRDTILKGTGASGGGAPPGGGGGGGKRTMTRAAFDALAPIERVKVIKEVTVVD